MSTSTVLGMAKRSFRNRASVEFVQAFTTPTKWDDAMAKLYSAR